MENGLSIIIGLVFLGFIFVSLWKLFEKAGREGWEGIVPVYNIYILTKLAGKPGWWVLLMFIPYIGFIWQIWVWNLVVQKFGKGTGFTVGVVLLPIVFIPILAFGDAKWQEDMEYNVDDFGKKIDDSNFESNSPAV